MSEIKVNSIVDASGGNTATINGVVPNVNNIRGKNKIINGNFDVWQRGSSFNSAGTIYTADRWEVNTGNASITVNRGGFTAGQTEVPNNPKYYLNVLKAGNTSATQFRQKLEDVRVLSGESVTLTAYVDISSTFVLDVFQNYGSAGDAQLQTHTAVAETIVSSTTNWKKVQWNITLASVSGKSISGGDDYTLFRIVESATNTTNAKIAQVQLEAGDTASGFEHLSYGETLALCQRYYQKGRYKATSGSTTGYTYHLVIPYIMPMRASPTTNATSSNWFTTGGGTTTVSIESFHENGLVVIPANTLVWYSIAWDYTFDAEL